ncbi:hypothetical protein ACFWP0_17615 [Achromobacter sp. NPDC058515]|uniref:hypothetical protein n=1 Tax=Achromobacter sp. NPDC058515 TaxID=3346533 RepID=UPI003656CAC5
MSHLPVAAQRGVLRIVRLSACGLALSALAACGASRLDEVPVAWTSFRDPRPVVLPSDPAQCPDLAGVYQAAGEYRAGDRQSKSLADLYLFLAHPLDLHGLRGGGTPEWSPAPQATVAFAPGTRGWDVQAQDGQGGRFSGQLPVLDGARDSVASPALFNPRMPGGIVRYTGCAQGRLWISVRADWAQYESMGVQRHVALLRRDAGGLLVTMQRESDSIGMLPWYSNDGAVSQYWFAPAPGAGAP